MPSFIALRETITAKDAAEAADAAEPCLPDQHACRGLSRTDASPESESRPNPCRNRKLRSVIPAWGRAGGFAPEIRVRA